LAREQAEYAAKIAAREAKAKARGKKPGGKPGLLASRPLRLRNLAGLILNRTLVQRGDGWWIPNSRR
jgi:hypothetical protein